MNKNGKEITICIPYLVFPGNCKEALEFYTEVFDGEIISITTYAQSPVDTDSEHQNRIFDSEFRASGLTFKASDDLPNHQVNNGNNISFFISFSDSNRRKEIFSKLKEQGNVLFPLDDNFGMLRDKFGIQWMLTLN